MHGDIKLFELNTFRWSHCLRQHSCESWITMLFVSPHSALVDLQCRINDFVMVLVSSLQQVDQLLSQTSFAKNSCQIILARNLKWHLVGAVTVRS